MTGGKGKGWWSGIPRGFGLGWFPLFLVSCCPLKHIRAQFIFWARDFELSVSNRIHLNKVKKEVTGKALLIFKFLNAPGLLRKHFQSFKETPVILKCRRLAPSFFFFFPLGVRDSNSFPEYGKVGWFRLVPPGNSIKLY